MSERPNDNDASQGDERLDRVIGALLRFGVIASALVVVAGGILLLGREGRQPAPDLHSFRAEPAELYNLGGIVREAGSLNSRGLIMLGLLILIATPVARVIFCTVAFAGQRDFLYVFFTLLVLAVLLYSLFSGYLSEAAV